MRVTVIIKHSLDNSIIIIIIKHSLDNSIIISTIIIIIISTARCEGVMTEER